MQRSHRAKMVRIVLYAFIALCLFAQTHALIGSLIGGAVCTTLSSIAMGGLAPIYWVSLFASSSYTFYKFGENIEMDTNKAILKDRIKEAKNPKWFSCEKDHAYFVNQDCSKKNSGCKFTLAPSQNSAHCNVCGKDMLWALIYTQPEDLTSYTQTLLCKDIDNTITPNPFSNLPHGLWDCAKVPHYSECKKCDGAPYAMYKQWTNAGPLLACFDTKFSLIEQKLV